jgi:hypothetical protein
MCVGLIGAAERMIANWLPIPDKRILPTKGEGFKRVAGNGCVHRLNPKVAAFSWRASQIRDWRSVFACQARGSFRFPTDHKRK